MIIYISEQSFIITHLIDDEKYTSTNRSQEKRYRVRLRDHSLLTFRCLLKGSVFLEPIVFALFLATEILKSFFLHTRNCVQLFRPCLQVLHC